MSYIGLNPQTQLLNTSSQNFSGNGVATQFTLNRNVASASDLDVIISNVAQRPFIDYTAGNVQLLFTSAPGAGSNNITVTYRAGALNSLNLTANVFPAGTVGAPGVYSLAANNSGIYWANATSVSVSVAGTERATFNATAASTSNVTGALTVTGGIGATGNLNTSGLVRFTDTTNSGNINSGALVVSGGVGIQGNLNVGQNITCVGDFTVNGTFTTTGTDSLDVTDPFIFLANANPGDTYDSGVVAQYYDGSNTRYTGYFRDITDGKYKFFGNLLTRPTSTVDTTDPSFQYVQLVAANVSATGNVSGNYILGNAAFVTGLTTTAPNAIVNTNSTMIIPASNGNIIGNVNSNTITTIASTGLFVTGLISSTGNITATANIAAGNIVTGGLISATGNVTSTANVSGGNVISGAAVIASTVVSATGNVDGGNINTAGLITSTGNVTGGNINTAGLITSTGNVTGGNVITGGDVSASGLISATGNVTGGNLNATGLSLSGNVISAINTTSAITTTANITGGNINVTGANILGGTLTANGLIALQGGATTNTSLGTAATTGNLSLGGVTQTGFIQIGRSTATQTLNIANAVTSSGNTKTVSIGENGAAGSTTTIAIGAAAGTGSLSIGAATPVTIANTGGTALSVAGNITGGNILTGGVISATGNLNIGNVTTGIVSASGNVSSAGNVIAGNVTTSGLITATGNVTGGNILTGAIVSAAGNITSAGNIDAGWFVATTGVTAGSSGFSATGNVTGGNIITGGLATVTGNITSSANIAGGNLLAAGLSLSSNVLSALNTTSGITTTANITGGNILFGSGIVSGTGNISGGNLSIGTGIATLGSIINANANGVGNIGSASLYFNTVFAKATSAQYADLAERYVSDAEYAPGTVLDFGGEHEVTISSASSSPRVAGVVSTDPAYVMNAGQEGKHTVVIALTGRVPTSVVGTVRKGDMMVSAGGGYAQSSAAPAIGTVIGKALEDFDGETGVIEVVVGRL